MKKFIFLLVFIALSLVACTKNSAPTREEGFKVSQVNTINLDNPNWQTDLKISLNGETLNIDEALLKITLIKKESAEQYLYLITYEVDGETYSAYIRLNVSGEKTSTVTPEPTDDSLLLQKAFNNSNFNNVVIYDELDKRVSAFTNNYVASYQAQEKVYFRWYNNSWRVYSNQKWQTTITVDGTIYTANDYYKKQIFQMNIAEINYENVTYDALKDCYNLDASFVPTLNDKGVDKLSVYIANQQISRFEYLLDNQKYQILFNDYDQFYLDQALIDGNYETLTSDLLKITNLNITTSSLQFSLTKQSAASLYVTLTDGAKTYYSKEVTDETETININNLQEETTYYLMISRVYGEIKLDLMAYEVIKTDYNDVTPPTLDYQGAINATYGSNYLEAIKKTATIKDNHDSLADLKFEFDFSVITGLGDFEVNYKITDKKGNSTTGKVLMHISADSNGPEITVNGTYFVYYNISDVPDLKTFFSVTDAIDGDITVTDKMLNITNEDLKNGVNKVLLTVKDSDGNETKMEITIEIREGEVLNKVTLKENITKVDANNLPSVGNPRVLVIPVAIDDYAATEEMRETIQKGFFGSSEETGWESLASYYYKSSYGKLNITGTVTDWYHVKKTQNEYAKYRDSNNYIYGSTMIMDEALTYFKNTYNYNDYDTNSDGCIDAVYMIYNVPIGGNKSTAEENFYWAFTYWDYYERDYGYNASGYAYVFASYEFFSEKLYYAKASAQPTINAETFIHETGHLFGMNDFYDTTADDKYNNAGGFGGADMMDYNVGDHHPYTKMLLGWANPYYISQSGTYKIGASTLTGESIVINTGSSFDSPFGEYFIIDLYSFVGLNEREMPGFYDTTKNYAGVRVTKINSTLDYKDGYYYFKYNNGDTNIKEIELMEADYSGKLHCSVANAYSSLSDYYLPNGASFGNGSWTNYKLSNGKNIPFVMTVISCDAYSATIEITFK